MKWLFNKGNWLCVVSLHIIVEFADYHMLLLCFYHMLYAFWFSFYSRHFPPKTIVCSANGNNPEQKGFKVKLTADGQFRLNEAATDKQIWVADSAGTGVAYAAMLDAGNFVLANLKSINLWESFDQPTDTILPTQTLNQEAIFFDIRKQITEEGDSSLPCNMMGISCFTRQISHWMLLILLIGQLEHLMVALRSSSTNLALITLEPGMGQ